MVKDRNFKYDNHIEHNMCLLSHDKLVPLNGRGRRQSPNFETWDPLYNF